jgi:hypothetical protein
MAVRCERPVHFVIVGTAVRARIKAAEGDTSVSALVARFLTELAAGETDAERLKREERAVRARIGRFRAKDRLPREDLHRRDL